MFSAWFSFTGQSMICLCAFKKKIKHPCELPLLETCEPCHFKFDCNVIGLTLALTDLAGHACVEACLYAHTADQCSMSHVF